MGVAQGVMAVTGAVANISAKNKAARQAREQAAAQKYFANLKYENDLIAANAQREAQKQQSFLQQMQAQAVRLQEDYNLREQDIQNLIQAGDRMFQAQSQQLAAETQAVQMLAEADKQSYLVSQEGRTREGQLVQESEAANQQQQGRLAEVAAALQQGDTQLAAFLAMTAASGQDSSSVSTQVLTQQGVEAAALTAAKAALESGRFSEQDLQNLVLSREFNSALERLGVLGVENSRASTQNKLDYSRQASAATQGNIARERDMNSSAVSQARAVLGGQRVLQDQAMTANEAFNELGYRNTLTNLELQRSSQNTSADMQRRASKGAGLFDYLNLGATAYGGYVGAGGKPLFSGGGAASSLVSPELFKGDPLNTGNIYG